MEETAVYLATEAALSADERKRFLLRAGQNNPRFRGAHVADICETLYSQDSYLKVRETLCEEHADELKGWKSEAGAATDTDQLFACGVFAAIYAYGMLHPSWDNVQRMMVRIDAQVVVNIQTEPLTHE